MTKGMTDKRESKGGEVALRYFNLSEECDTLRTELERLKAENKKLDRDWAATHDLHKVAQLEIQRLTRKLDEARGARDGFQTVNGILTAELERLRTDNKWLVELANNLCARLKETEAAHPIELGVVQAELERLRAQIREGNARFDATVTAVVADRLEHCPSCGQVSAKTLMCRSCTLEQNSRDRAAQ